MCYFLTRKEEHARVGISVGKKIGKAVCRNQVKRQVRSMIDEVFDFEEPFDLIIIVRPVYLKKSYAENRSELKKTIARIHQKTRGNV
ncbi:ribonuclease P protein component [Catenisphaera adipataccumulans]|uniref:Ribonuclease P protein component n=1 Tax=Catenisphaera adipataccumulans TaxID=700500 RepID=A0A7W8FXK8_9FIRM|nr:ribonuclease P protein component [Catenisphaera adipataccumulans]